jgi:hypothetical protein
MHYDLKKLPLLATAQEVARAVGVTDPRRLRDERLKPIAAIFVNGKLRPLFRYPTDLLYSTLAVNSNPSTPIRNAEA